MLVATPIVFSLCASLRLVFSRSSIERDKRLVSMSAEKMRERAMMMPTTTSGTTTGVVRRVGAVLGVSVLFSDLGLSTGTSGPSIRNGRLRPDPPSLCVSLSVSRPGGDRRIRHRAHDLACTSPVHSITPLHFTPFRPHPGSRGWRPIAPAAALQSPALRFQYPISYRAHVQYKLQPLI
ncbi:hypothetical protein NMY22_g11418 [Coprinellus aureogranulatus]|nr:hypothetical protein NMY22_g11418 [Coprinellus aureogranulatus]